MRFNFEAMYRPNANFPGKILLGGGASGGYFGHFLFTTFCVLSTRLIVYCRVVSTHIDKVETASIVNPGLRRSKNSFDLHVPDNQNFVGLADTVRRQREVAAGMAQAMGFRQSRV